MQAHVNVSEDKVVILPSQERIRAGRFSTGGAIVSILAVYFTTHPLEIPPPRMLLLLLLVLVPLAWALIRSFRVEPLCVIDREGVFDNITLFGVGWVKWEEITEIKIFKSVGIDFIGIHLKDPGAFAKKLGLFKKAYQYLNTSLKYPPVNFYPKPLGLTAQELFELIEKFRKP